MMKRLAALVFAVLMLAGCSNTVSKFDNGNGTCEQTNRMQLIGVTLSTNRSLVNC